MNIIGFNGANFITMLLMVLLALFVWKWIEKTTGWDIPGV